jgi:hypothetical protein
MFNAFRKTWSWHFPDEGKKEVNFTEFTTTGGRAMSWVRCCIRVSIRSRK